MRPLIRSVCLLFFDVLYSFFYENSASFCVKTPNNVNNWAQILLILFSMFSYYTGHPLSTSTLLKPNLMYQSNRSFNIPPPPGIRIFRNLLFKFSPPEAEKLLKCPIIGPFLVIKCPHPWETFQ